jgi:pilus assembly protein CpaF
MGIWNCRFVGGRLSAVFPPISPEGISVTIRKFGSVRLTLDDLVGRGALSRKLADALVQEVLDRKNMRAESL